MKYADVWVLDGGAPGHLVQSEGILDVLERDGLHLSRASIRCSTHLRGLFRSPVRRLMDIASGQLALQIVRMFSDFQLPQSSKPSFIISSGGDTAYLSRALSLSMGVPNVFVGFPGPFPAHWFTVLMPPIDRPFVGTKVIPTVFTPNRITKAKCHDAANQYWRGSVPQNCWALLIGGTSPSHRYTLEDWKAVADGVSNLSRQYGVRWLITTSRRTGADVESQLQRLLDPTCIQEFTPFSSNKKVVAPYLGAAQLVFVTQDSRTMIGEALLSGRRVVSLAPRNVKIKPRYQHLSLEAIYALPQVMRVDAVSMKNYRAECHPASGVEPEALLRRSVRELQTQLGLDSYKDEMAASTVPSF